MKTITFTNIQISEVTITKGDTYTVAISYSLLGDDGKPYNSNRIAIPQAQLSSPQVASLDSIFNAITSKIKTSEQIT